jgi:hypothetical protein
MSPKEKGEDIYQMMAFAIKGVYPNFDYEGAKKCAIIAVDETIKAVQSDWSFMEKRKEYWQEVKQEINKL